ncbi:MAG: DUF1801 domain-containing protein [Candidatus Solibacter sp.]
MAEAKTKPTNVTVASYLAGLPEENKRADAKAIIKMMQDATGEKGKMWGPSIIGFGTHHYVYESGREGDWPLACFSPRKAATVIYGLTGLAESDALLAKLGKHTRSGSCVHIKRLADVDLKVLEELIRKGVALKQA